ncbi:uncharacterized protein si:dkey-33c12.4 [Denticeps clupeoides]|uniref:Uncharacterized protein n=1 Tax=Denticeps clupeoides TaxID=299321 RepID=A0AAY4EU63_9TELE|nr:tetratricopeptide repeat protein 31 [Denticeps clupeoides]
MNDWSQEFMRPDPHMMATHEAFVDLLTRRRGFFNPLDFGGIAGLDNMGPYSDNSDNDDFMPRRINRIFSRIRISHHEAEKNATELVAEEERLKVKAEKKRQKKMRQKEKKRLEKENANKSIIQQTQQTKAEEDIKINIKNKTPELPPDPGPQAASDSSSEEEEESLPSEPEELDMNSCFVSNAAAIAKRKLDQKPRDKKEKTTVSSGKTKQPTTDHKVTTGPKQSNEPKDAKEEPVENTEDLINRSLELALIGNQCAARGNLDMAVKYFTDAIKHNPKEYKLFGNRSFCYEKMQEYEKALTDADLALSMNPQWIKGLYRKGRALTGLKRYYDASMVYQEVLKLDNSCPDAAQELMRVQIMALMEMGFSREVSSNALIIHGTAEKALEALTGLTVSYNPVNKPEEEWETLKKSSVSPKSQPIAALQRQPNPPLQAKGPVAFKPVNVELFPIWVGCPSPVLTEAMVYDLFSTIGPVHSVKVLKGKGCAFVNYIKKADSEKAVEQMHGRVIDSFALLVRFPDRIHTHLGASKSASTDSNGKMPDECHFWRTTGCIKKTRCTYRHIPENKGIDLPKAK